MVLIPGEIYRQLFFQEHSIQDTTLKALSTLVFQLMDSLEEVQTCNLEQRLARFLLNNASMDGEVKITKQALASHLGTTREGIARLMQSFKAEGMVNTRRGVIDISNETSLASLVTPDDAEWPR